MVHCQEQTARNSNGSGLLTTGFEDFEPLRIESHIPSPLGWL